MQEPDQALLPLQEEGKEIVAEAHTRFSEVATAVRFFGIVYDRLLQVDLWHQYAGAVTARFQLVDETGNTVKRPLQEGDYFRIDIPGPGSSIGEGYDWVRVEKLQETNTATGRMIGFIVRPSAMPGDAPGNTAHFYDEKATSTFLLTQEENAVKMMVIDRNVQPNADNKETAGKLRDMIAGAGAMRLFSKIQWQQLAEGLLHHT